MNITKWDERFIELAKLVGSWSKDPSTKVGAAIVDRNHRIISVGYNGFPKGIKDSEDRLNNRESKYDIVIHAEANALSFASKPLEGCTLYTYPFQPCSRCAGLIIQHGIKRVVSQKDNKVSERTISWAKNFELANRLFGEAGVEMEYYNA